MDIAATCEEDDTPPDTRVWAWARWLVGQMFVFGEPQAIAAIGLPRRRATALARWLWSAEVVVRRLLLAAALLIKVELKGRPRPNPRSGSPAPSNPGKETARLPSQAFRVFSVHRPRMRAGIIVIDDAFLARPVQPAKPRKPAPLPVPQWGVLPADPLLLIGAAKDPRKHKSRTRVHIRKGRISRWSPDYGSHIDPDLAQARYNRSMFGPFPTYPLNPAPRAPRKPPAERYPYGHAPIIPPRYNPAHDEQLRPAPCLVARMIALARVLQKPEAYAERLARLLARHKLGPQRFAAIPAPVYVRRKKDKFPGPPGEEEIPRAVQRLNDAISALDTS